MPAEELRMKGAVCREFGAPLVWEELRLAPPARFEVRVKIAACAICGSDLTYLDGGWGGVLPAIFGHEAAGVVEAVGDGAAAAVGDPVLVTLLRACGRCRHCAAGAPQQCRAEFAIDQNPRIADAAGRPVYAGLRTGAFAEYAVVHDSQIAPLPADRDFAAACLLSCGALTGVGAVVNTARLPPLASAAIVGCGGVGLNCVQAARLSGARPLVAIDLDDRQLALARDFGATCGINGAADDFAGKALAASGGDGFDFVFVAAGSPRAIEQSLPLLARRGALVLVGMPPDGQTVRIDACAVADGGRRIIGSKMGDAALARDIPHLLRLWRDGELAPEKLIGARYPPEQINDAVAAARAGGGLRKVVIF